MTKYPYPDGDVKVLGPEVFVSADEAVICWRGENYLRQSWPAVERDVGDMPADPVYDKEVTAMTSWPIRLRLLLLIPGSHRWNGWVRDLTARMERRT